MAEHNDNIVNSSISNISESIFNMETFKNPKVIIVVGCVLVLLFIYYYTRDSFSSKKSKKKIMTEDSDSEEVDELTESIKNKQKDKEKK